MKKLSILFFMCLFLTTYLTSAQTDLLPPDAKKIPYSETHHGIELKDDYHWMVDPEKKDPDVLKYIKEENAYTDAVLKDLEPLQEKLFNEMLARVKEDDTDVPVPKDNYFYYTRSESGKPYSIHCRKKGSLDSKEEIILDVNKLAEGQQYYRVGRMALSKSHRYLAWVYDTTGTEWYILQIKDLETGEVFQEMIEGISSLIWANDDKTIYYSKNNETRRSTKVYRHTLGNDPKDDVLLFEEKDDSFYCWVTKTKSKKFILIGTGSDTSSEIYYLDANDPNSEMKLFQAREPKLTYFPMDHEDKFFIITDKDGALNNKIMVTDIDKTGKENWKDFIPARPETPLSCDIFKDYMVIYEKIQGVEKIKIYEFKNGKSHYIKFDEPIYSINFGSNSNYDTQMFRYSYTSLTTPWTIYEYDMKKRKTTMLKRYDVQGEYNPKDYKSERVLATAPDGTKVPISLVYKKSLF
ncbi:MAG: oligopeptidase B, partial [bacterium]|nr:oligopeptidase B [bacterium]